MKTIFSGVLFALLLVSMLAGAFGIQSTKANASPLGEIVQAAGTDWWPMFHHDVSHAGASTSTGPTTNHTLWTYTTGGWVLSCAVANGFVYAGSHDFKIYCLKAATGALVWSYTTGDVIIDCPAVVGGFVYVDSGDTKIYCLNATTGTFVWSYTTGLGMDSCPAVVGGLVYVGGLDRKVYCLNATTGAFVWSYTTSGYVDSSPAVVGGFVYVGSWDSNVYCLNAATGARVWSYKTGGVVWGSSPAVASGLVYVGSNDTKVYCLNAANGALVWSYKTGGLPGHPAVVDTVYVGSEDGRVYAFGEPVAVSISPSIIIMDVGQSRQFTSNVSGGTLPYYYQWYLNGAPVSGATSSTWTFKANSSSSYNVHVNVTDSVIFNAKSNVALVTVNPTLSVTISPSSVIMDANQSQFFNSSVSGGTSPYSYQWYLDGTLVSGATASSWTFAPTSSGPYTIYLNATDSADLIAISPTSNVTVNPIVPEFPPLFFLSLFIIATLLAALVSKRKRNLRT